MIRIAIQKYMESYLISDRYDLESPDGIITSLKKTGPNKIEATVTIDNISPAFVGYKIDKNFLSFNLKSTLAQLGVNGVGKEFALDPFLRSARVTVELTGLDKLGTALLNLLSVGAYIGKIFAADPRRRVRDPEYLSRMFGRSDRDGKPLLSLGGLQGSEKLILEKVEGRTIAYLSLQSGTLRYDDAIFGYLPTLEKALHNKDIRTRNLLQLNQIWQEGNPKIVTENELLLVRTLPLHIRTVFGKVVDELLPEG